MGLCVFYGSPLPEAREAIYNCPGGSHHGEDIMMNRWLLLGLVGLGLADDASARCRRFQPPPPYVLYYYCPPPVYPWAPNVWGGPPPAYVPAPPPKSPVRPAAQNEDIPAKTNKESVPEPRTVGEDLPKIKRPELPIPGEKAPKLLPTPKEEKSEVDAKSVEQFLVPGDSARTASATEVKVGFFNHTTRDLVLVVNNEEIKLPAAQYVTVRLPRAFQWMEKGGKAADVKVPVDAEGIEIVFRK